MLSCKDMTDLATEYTEGALPRWRSLSYRMHLAMCGHCRRYVAQLRRTAEALRQLAPHPSGLDPDTRESVMAAFRSSSAVLLLGLGVASLSGCPLGGASNDDDDEMGGDVETVSSENVGDESLEGHTPRGFQGQGTGLFTGDNINPNFPDGDGVQIFTTLEMPAEIDADTAVHSAILRLPDYSTNGSPFADLGDLNAQEIVFDAFSSALWDAEVVADGADCVLGSEDGDLLACDVTTAVRNSIEVGRDSVQFRIRFDDAGDSDGSADLLVLNPSDSNEVIPGLVELDVVISAE
ncbi:MAG: zf-HC2 domain-containing protein [Deltaproteobacteria bacterium]|nr:zf-HC2 domain-containing protein [Deltaproteobacteria bacterium]